MDTLLTEQNIKGARGSRVGAFEGLTHTPAHPGPGFVTLLNPKLYPPRLPGGGVTKFVKDLINSAKQLKGSTGGAITPKGALSGAASALQVWGAVQTFKEMRGKGIDPLEAGATSGGQLFGGIAGPSGGAGALVANLVDMGLRAGGASKDVTDVSTSVTSVLPGNFTGTATGEGARGWLNVARFAAGDPKAGSAIDRQAKEMIEGKGAKMPLSGYARSADIAADLASGKDFEQTMLKQKFVGQEQGLWNASIGPMVLAEIKLAESLKQGKRPSEAAKEARYMLKDAVATRVVNRALDRVAPSAKENLDHALENAERGVERGKEWAGQKVEETKEAATAYIRDKAEPFKKFLPW